jgi:histone H3/H4
MQRIRRYADYDNQARAVLVNAAAAAERDGRQTLDTLEVAMALASVPWPGAEALASHGVDRPALERLRGRGRAVTSREPGLTADARSMLERAETDAELAGRVTVTRVDLLVAIAKGHSAVARLMAAKGLSASGLRRDLG